MLGSVTDERPPTRRPRKFSDQARKNMSKAHRGLRHSAEHRKAIAQGRLRNPDGMARSSDAALAAVSRRLEELDAVPLLDALQERGIDARGRDYPAAYNWATNGRGGELRSFIFIGPRGARCVRSVDLPELHAELERYRCTWEGPDGRCTRYGLLSKPDDARCHDHTLAVPRAGKLTAAEFAEKHAIFPAYLTARLAAGEIPSEPVGRGKSPAAWLIDEASALTAIRQGFCCKTDGCERFALGPSGYCSCCVRRELLIGKLDDFQKRIPGIMLRLRRVPTVKAAKLLGWPLHRVRDELTSGELIALGRVLRFGYDPQELKEVSGNDPRVCGQLSVEIAGRVGRIPMKRKDGSTLTDEELEAVRQRLADPAWPQGRIAIRFRVSRDQVKRYAAAVKKLGETPLSPV